MRIFREIGRFIWALFKSVLILALLVLVLLVGFRVYLLLHYENHFKTVEEIAKICDNDPMEAIIVPGASVLRDRTPSPILRNRLDRALELWKAGVADAILVTGDHRDGEYDETDVMWEYLIVRGVPEEKILRDYYGFSTGESIDHAANVFHMKRAAVVSQSFHEYRLLYYGDFYEMDLTACEAEDTGSAGSRFLREVREWGACAKAYIECIFE